MLEIAPIHFFSSCYEARAPDHSLIELKASVWRERAELRVQGVEYELHREGALSGDFLLECRGKIVARATKPSAFRDRFEMQIGDRSCVLRKPGIFSRNFVLYSDDREIGWIRRASFFSRRTQIDLPEQFPLPIQLFIFWLALLLWNRQRRRN